MYSLRMKIFVIVFLCNLINLSTATAIKCYSNPNSTNEFVEIVRYSREALGIYKINHTNSVNLLLPFVEFKTHGMKQPQADLVIAGAAIVSENNTIENCDFDFTTNPQYSGLFGSVKQCIEENLCPQFGNVNENDLVQGRTLPYDFGKKTVLYTKLPEAFPNLLLPKRQSESAQPSLRSKRSLPGEEEITEYSELQSTLNDLVDSLIAAGVSFVSADELGKISLPDANEKIPGFLSSGSIDLKNGTLRGLQNAFRPKSVSISAVGFRYSLQLFAQVPDIQMTYENYHLKHGWTVNRKGNMKITVKNIKIGVDVVVNYNTIPCSIKVTFLDPKIEGLSFDMSGGGISDFVLNSALSVIFNTFASTIFSTIQTKVDEALKTASEKFDCEKLRPHT